MKNIWPGVATALVAMGVFWMVTSTEDKSVTTQATSGTRAIVEVSLPDTLSANAEKGKTVYTAKCAACHATDGAGQLNVAPPLVHIIYEPSHHGDEAFQRAVALGVRAHHWQFGDMPPVEGLTRGEVAMIVTYVRELQRANGIK